MAIDEIARAMAMDAMNSGGGGSISDTYTRSEIDTKLSGKADADKVEEMQYDIEANTSAIEANKAALTESINKVKDSLVLNPTMQYNLSLDDISETSLLYCDTSCTGKPDGVGYCMVRTTVRNENNIIQELIAMNASNSSEAAQYRGKHYTRVKVSGTWYDWRD